jgi:hypothetical protein
MEAASFFMSLPRVILSVGQTNDEENNPGALVTSSPMFLFRAHGVIR